MNLFYKNKTALIQYFYIYVMLSSGGMAMPSYIGNDNFVLLVLAMGACGIFLKHSLQNLQQKYLFFIGALFTFMLLIVLSSTLSLGTTLNIISILLIVYASYKIDPQNYIQRFIKLTYYIAVVSVILFAITRIFGFSVSSILYPFLYPSYSQGRIYSYGGFLYRFVFLHSYRNCGPFGEPGQYQCVLSVALYFSLFHSRLFTPKDSYKYLLTFFITLITTLSTSGYIALGIIIICFACHSHQKLEKRTKRLFIGMILVAALFSQYTDLGREFIHTTVYSKIYTENGMNLNNNTGGARVASITGVLTAIAENPSILWGVGYDELENMHLEGCAGLLYLLLAIGIIPYSILFGFCFSQVFRYNIGVWDIAVRILLVVNMGLGQPHIMNCALFTMMLYPYFIANSIKKQRKLSYV